MNIKLNPKARATGIPRVTIACSPMTLNNGMPHVFVALVLDEYLNNAVIGSLRLTPAEARDLAARLVTSANDADALVRSTTR